jgi:hypothetical protein
LLDEMITTERDGPSTANSSSPARPLWPFGVGLLVLGALLGFVVLRPAPTAPRAEPSPARSGQVVAGPALTPSVVAPVPLQSAVALPSTVPSAPALPSAVPEKKAKTRAAAPARIPTDLENPF